MELGFLACYSEYVHRNMKEITLFDDNTILECDMIILQLEEVFNEYEISGYFNGMPEFTRYDSSKIILDMEKRRNELLEFLNSGKPVVILNGNDDYRYRYTGRKEYSGTGRNTSVTNIVADIHSSEILPIKLKTLKLTGKETTLKNKKIEEFYKKYSNNFKYSTVYENIDNDKTLLNIKNTEKVVGFFEKIKNGIMLFLPSLDFDKLTQENGRKLEKQYFDDIYTLAKKLSNNEEIILPEYSKQYLLTNEKDIINSIETEKEKLNLLQKSIEVKEEKLRKTQEEKIIFTGSGTSLEKTVVAELKQMGFNILKYDESSKDEDIIISYNDKVAIVEVKGVDGSATEKHTSQTVKWKSMYHIEHDILPKGFLIVNAFKDKELENRKNTFPNQMLKYAKQQEICLLTTLQVFNIRCYLKCNPDKKDEILEELYNTVGTYDKFIEWNLNIKKI